jgi:hypothetical protein
MRQHDPWIDTMAKLNCPLDSSIHAPKHSELELGLGGNRYGVGRDPLANSNSSRTQKQNRIMLGALEIKIKLYKMNG